MSAFQAQEWQNLILGKDWKDAFEEAGDRFDPTVKTDIQGYDIDPDVVRMARENAERALILPMIHLQARPVSALSHSGKYGFIITNPPYGERLGEKEQLAALYQEMGRAFQNLDTWSEYVITSFEQAEKYIGKKAAKNRKIYNGMMKTYFYMFPGPKPPVRKVQP